MAGHARLILMEKSPAERTEADLLVMHDLVAHIDFFKELSEDTTLELCRQMRYAAATAFHQLSWQA